MHWFSELFHAASGQAAVAGAVLILALVVAGGLALGSVRFRGIGLGIAGVLFAGLAFGHFGLHVDMHVLEFAREFGLILFVYSIGVQVGPGFLASLRRQGLPLNLMAAAIVLLGAGLTLLFCFVGRLPMPAAVGLFAGATTNTPSLAAAQQALADVNASEDLARLPGLGYAVAYPFGILGIILAILSIRLVFRIDPAAEEKQLRRSLESDTPRLARANLEVTNANLNGLALKDIPMLATSSGGGGHQGRGSGIVISRIFQHGKLDVPQPETRIGIGDVLLAVGSVEELNQLRLVVGRESLLDLRTLPSAITTRRLIVTKKAVLGRSLAELDFARRFGVAITRISRADVEMAPTADFRLQYGDTVLAVGEAEHITKVSSELGDSAKSLNHPQIIPIFVGIALGVIAGSVPLAVPGVPVPVKLGLAGGPLLVAMVLSRIGRVGPLVWYLPISANFMLRELGIALFLACVGLKAGDQFISTLAHGPGLYWMAMAAIITLAPLLLVAIAARLFVKTNFMALCGLLAGSMTDPPALAFANSFAGSEAPSVAYATVYPLTMLLRVLCAQIMVLMFVR